MAGVCIKKVEYFGFHPFFEDYISFMKWQLRGNGRVAAVAKFESNVCDQRLVHFVAKGTQHFIDRWWEVQNKIRSQIAQVVLWYWTSFVYLGRLSR